MRLDIFISTNFNLSREQAKRLIKDEKVSVNGKIVTKPAFDTDISATVNLLEKQKYVSRGGYKLEAALQHFNISISNRIALDVGASTGGFTDCLLQNEVEKVYCIDVGSAQLHSSLLHYPNIINYENINARYITQYIEDKVINLTPPPNLVVIDVSFISVTKIIGEVAKVCSENCDFIVLIKPQFEMEEQLTIKNGVIKSDDMHQKAIKRVTDFLHHHQFSVKGLIPSPIKGGDGNKEFLVYFRK